MLDTKRTPSFDEIVECERIMLSRFDWNLMILQPVHFVSSFLANGVIYQSDSNSSKEEGPNKA